MLTRLFPLTLLATTLVPLAFSQAGGQGAQPLPNMQAIAEALGVTCEFCHAPQTGPPKRAIARQMIAMTRQLNETVLTATGKEAGQAARVDCVTCHRGVTIPRPLTDVVWQTITTQGAEAAAKQYRELRAQFYGKATYDFSEQTLIAVGQRLANARANDAVELLKLNLEFFPDSSKTYVALAYAYTRKVDDASAITALEKAVELNPADNVARGQLEQLKSYRRR
jgi:hypothetical protein